MSSKYERMTDLYFQALNEMLEPENWSHFLTTACRNFRLSFHEQVMLYAQKPDATAVLPIEGRNGWNRRFGRWVNRGAKGIAMFDGQSGVRYFFDIADTHESTKAKPVPIWEVHQEDVDAVTEALETRFGSLDAREPLGTALISAANNAVEDHFQDYLAALLECKMESNLDVLDAESVEAMFKPLLQNSVGYMLLARCGVDPELYFQVEDFRYIGGFNTLQTLNALGTAVSDMSAMCLSEIARTALQRQSERENHTFAESSEKKYSVVRNQKNEPERGEEYDSHHLHEAGGLSSSESDPADIPAGAWEIRKNAPQVPDGTPESDLYESADQRAALPPSDGDRADRPEPNGADGLPDGPGSGSDGGSESRRPNEVGGPDEQHPGIGRGTDFAGADLRIDEIPPLPSVEEQISFLGGGFVLPEQDDNQQSFFTPVQLPQQVIDEALCIGFNDRDSTKVICAYFMKDKPLEDNAAFLREKYGTNGAGLIIQGREYAVWYDREGIQVSNGRTVRKRYTTLVTWVQAAKRIRELLDMGRYMPQQELEEAPIYERRELAKSLLYARQELTEKALKLGCLSLTSLAYSEKGGFPEMEAKANKLLGDSNTLSQLVEEWSLFAVAYTHDHSLMHSRRHDPATLLHRLEDLQREPLIFTAAEGYAPQRQFFISDDEIEAILRGSENSVKTRLDTFSFF